MKCPEQRPTCRNCERLGFNCCYEITLNWLPVDTIKNHIGDTNERRQCCESVPVEKWMFLATTPHDFDSDAESSMQRPDEISCYPISSMIESAFPLHEDQARRHSCNTILPLRYVSSSSMSSDEGYLWTYFDECITPQCVINPRFNPYRDIVLRIAAISPDGPLLHCVLAVAANQLYSIGLARYKSIMWLHRAKALHLLRARVKDASFGTEAWPYDQIEEGQIIASTLMLCFFEVRIVVHKWHLMLKRRDDRFYTIALNPGASTQILHTTSCHPRRHILTWVRQSSSSFTSSPWRTFTRTMSSQQRREQQRAIRTQSTTSARMPTIQQSFH